MERRLVPVNALIALCAPGDVYPSPFAECGYQLAGIEVPVVADGGRVVIDAVLFRADRNILIVVRRSRAPTSRTGKLSNIRHSTATP